MLRIRNISISGLTVMGLLRSVRVRVLQFKLLEFVTKYYLVGKFGTIFLTTEKILHVRAMKRKINEVDTIDNGDNDDGPGVSEPKKSADNIHHEITSLKEKLKEDQNQIPALKEFIKLCEDDEKRTAFVTLYLKTSPECKELLNLLKLDNRPQPEKLEVIWETLEGILSVTSENKDDLLLSSSGVFLVNKIMENHLKLLYSSLSQSSKESLAKSALKLMTYMVAQGKQALKEIVLTFDFSLKGFRAAALRRNSKAKPDVRTCFVRFCLAFFAFGDTSVIKKMLEEKGMGDLIMNDLHRDSAESILVVLQTLKDKVIGDENLLKKTKLLFFNSHVLVKLALLCKSSEPTVKVAALDLLTSLTTDTKVGICFFAKNYELNNKLLNPVLLKFLQSIRQHYLADSTLQSLVVSILQSCQDLIVPFFTALNLQMDVRASDSWFTNVKFITEIWRQMPLVSTMKIPANTMKDISFLTKLAIPPIVKKQQFNAALTIKNTKVQESILNLINVVLQRCIDLKKVVYKSLPNNLADECFMEVIQNLPDVYNVITLRQNLLTNKNKVKVSSKDAGVEGEKHGIDQLTDDERDGLSSLSMRILCLFQELKPGILTDSGFNICKLLFVDSIHGNKEITGMVLDVLLREDDSDTRMWLEKKLPGGTNIIQLVLVTLLACQDQQEIIQKGKQVLFKILKSVEFYEHHSNEIHLWIDGLLTLADNDDKNEVCRLFSNAVYKLLNDPYTLQQEILSLLKDSDNSVETCDFTALPIVLAKTFRKFEAPTACYRYLISSSMKLLICQDDPSALANVLISTCGGGDGVGGGAEVKDRYKDLFVFIKQLFSSLKIDHEAVDKISDLGEEESAGNEDEADIVIAVRELTKLASTKEKIEVKKILKTFLSTVGKLLEDDSNSLSVVITSKFVCTMIKILHESETASECKILVQKIQNIFLQIIPKLLSCEIYGETCAHTVLSLYNKFLVLDNSNVWRDFKEELAIQCVQSLKSSEAEFTVIKSVLDNLNVEETRNSASAFLQKLMPHLHDDTSIKALETVIACIMSRGLDANHSYEAFTGIIKVFAEKGIKPSSYKSVINAILLNEMFVTSLTAADESMMALCHCLYLLYPHPSILNSIDQTHLTRILELKTEVVFVDFLKLLLKSNASVCDLFIQCIADETISVDEGSMDLLCPLLSLVLKIMKTEDLPVQFRERITGTVWDEILSKHSLTDHGLSILTLASNFQSREKLIKSVECLLSLLQQKSSQMGSMVINVQESVCAFMKKVVLADDQECLVTVAKVMIKLFLAFEGDSESQKVVLKNLPHFVSMLTTDANLNLKSISKLWKPFVINVLKKHYTEAEYLTALSAIAEKLYTVSGKFGESSGIMLKDIHDMMVGHSKFLTIFIDEENKMTATKDSLTTFLRMITANSPDVCNSAFVSVLLMAYNGTLSKQDQEIFAMLKLYERNSCLHQFPTSWGKEAIASYKMKNQQQQANTTLRDISSFQILTNLEGKRVFKTAINFPSHLKLQENDVMVDSKDEMYDPRFLLLLFTSIMRPGNVVDCRHFVESGCLSVAIAGLTSLDKSVRKISYAVLAQFQDYLDSSRFREKAQVDFMMSLLKNSIYEEYMMVPTIWTVFIVRYVTLLMHPDQRLYNVLNHQLLRKPIIFFKELPLFMHFFHGNSSEHNLERAWIIKLLSSGLRDYTGYYMYKKSQVFELVLSCYGSVVCDRKTKRHIMDLLTKACSIQVAAFDLVITHGLLSWLHFQIVGSPSEHVEKIITILHTLMTTFRNSQQKEESGKRQLPKRFTSETLILAMHCLREHESLSQDALLQICSVMTWALNTTDDFGSLLTRMRLDDRTRLLKSIQSLMTNGCENSNKSDIFSMFKSLVLKFVQNGNLSELENEFSLGKVRDQSTSSKENNATDIFLELLKWRGTEKNSDDVSIFIEIIQSTS